MNNNGKEIYNNMLADVTYTEDVMDKELDEELTHFAIVAGKDLYKGNIELISIISSENTPNYKDKHEISDIESFDKELDDELSHFAIVAGKDLYNNVNTNMAEQPSTDILIGFDVSYNRLPDVDDDIEDDTAFFARSILKNMKNNDKENMFERFDKIIG